MEWLQANWWWLLIGLGIVWLLFRGRGHGMGCGMGERGQGSHHGSIEGRSTEGEEMPRRRRGGCC